MRLKLAHLLVHPRARLFSSRFRRIGQTAKGSAADFPADLTAAYELLPLPIQSETFRAPGIHYCEAEYNDNYFFDCCRWVDPARQNGAPEGTLRWVQPRRNSEARPARSPNTSGSRLNDWGFRSCQPQSL